MNICPDSRGNIPIPYAVVIIPPVGAIRDVMLSYVGKNPGVVGKFSFLTVTRTRVLKHSGMFADQRRPVATISTRADWSQLEGARIVGPTGRGWLLRWNTHVEDERTPGTAFTGRRLTFQLSPVNDYDEN